MSKINVPYYTDKYFSRSLEILKKTGLNPFVTMQVFIRNGGIVGGIDEAVNLIADNSDIVDKGGFIRAVEENSLTAVDKAVMFINAPLQSIIELETLYLGVISAATTKASYGHFRLDTDLITERMRKLVSIAGNRPIFYFGARHYHYKHDAKISKACHRGGASGSSTDCGAKAWKSEGIGTIPHALVIAYAHRYGKKLATFMSLNAFDMNISKEVPRIALIDTFNRELSDIAGFHQSSYHGKLDGVRIDTCGENFGEGSIKSRSNNGWIMGRGVTAELAYNVRMQLDSHGFNDTKVVLSSGFGNPDKLKQFVDMERAFKFRLFDSLGIGQVIDASIATADIVKIDGIPLSKTGRAYRKTEKLRKVL